ncbi:MAG: YggT family protein [Candidatus Microsaccharimonas sossegonensis]|uniref:YggT family protein n=1 Tax=Candidatus Microsaccharimonas sossegonensis TaxID=2506948 RepID=A0A4Q0AGM2_9BACT|nr:MAG: YggT family protein [Candidatus Microsaccharimonas sossegonensis]
MVDVEQTEVRETTTDVDGAEVRRRSVTNTVQPSGVVVAQRIVWFIVGVVDALLAIRFILMLLGANQASGFVDFVYVITGGLVAPFVGIFGQPSYGMFMFDWSSILAIIVYSLIGLGIVKLMTLARPHEEV